MKIMRILLGEGHQTSLASLILRILIGEGRQTSMASLRVMCCAITSFQHAIR